MKTDITGIKLSNTNYTARLHIQPAKIFRFKWKTVIFASARSYYALNESSLMKGTKKGHCDHAINTCIMNNHKQSIQVIQAFSSSKHYQIALAI